VLYRLSYCGISRS